MTGAFFVSTYLGQFIIVNQPECLETGYARGE